MWQSTMMNRKASLQGKRELGKLSSWLTKPLGDPIGSWNPCCDLPCLVGNCPQGLIGLSQAGAFIRGKASHLEFLTEF